MPTATSTLTTYTEPRKLGAKVSATPSTASTMDNAPSSTSVAPLRSLYNRAARAFLHRDIRLTNSLIESAFHMLKPPILVYDQLQEQRRKWDILRITLDTTIYADPPAMDSLPEPLQPTLTQSSQTLMASIYSRSVAFFTPSGMGSAPNAAHLPPAVLITLLYSSLKLDCPEIGRRMAEEWLSRREAPIDDNLESEEGGYDKVLEIYCLLVLPKLGQWDHAKEFLQFETELSEPRREFLNSRLNAQHAEALASRNPTPSPPSPSSSRAPTPRSHSPAPSASSSSSLSTASTHTVVPSTPRGLSKLTQSTVIHSSSSSESSVETAIPRGQLRPPNGNARPRTPSSSTSSAASSSSPRTDIRTTPGTSQAPTILSLVKASLAPHLTTSKITTFVILFVIFPLISWVLRVRHRRRKQLKGTGTPLLSAGASTNVDLVRKRLQAAGGSDSNLITRLWKDTFRIVTDTVMMAGKGLV
ncbi:hypothetical protein FA13DRAFT_1736799 [Coprinellus micaceus]|uniref:Uncharacterized protein n=1 Tax=Coprinellus micaceus TaxID=71717 RepID=A0A4Y7SYU7_COPMI|nr:hypothetical protein FA13DRAFT_1736799 [Coprinellus micaceus]